MKKRFSVLLILCLIFVLAAGCSNQSEPRVEGGGTQNSESPAPPTNIDIDLTILSSTMVFAEIANIEMYPENYLGKTIKLSGAYFASYDESAPLDENNQVYHLVCFLDATGCCYQTIEFKWTGDHSYPNDYPVNDAIIELVGVFKSYNAFGYPSYYLEVDDIVILSS